MKDFRDGRCWRVATIWAWFPLALAAIGLLWMAEQIIGEEIDLKI